MEVREGLKHFLRDWSEEGDFTARFVLFNIMANEQSHITNLSCSCSPKATQGVGRGRLHPLVHSWSPTIGVLNFQIGLVSGHGPLGSRTRSTKEDSFDTFPWRSCIVMLFLSIHRSKRSFTCFYH